MSEFFNFLANLPLLILKKFRVFIEYLSNFIEMGVWKTRDLLTYGGLFLFLGYIIYNSFGAYEFDTSMTEYNSDGNIILKFKTLITMLGLPGILFFAGIILNQVWAQVSYTKEQRRYSVTLLDRLFATIPYLWLTVEMSISYFDYCLEFCLDLLPIDKIIGPFQIITSILEGYQKIPGVSSGVTGYALFFLFFYGIGRNKTSWKFFIRYHFIQAILFAALFGFQGHLFFLWANHNPLEELVNFIGVSLYSFILLVASISLISVWIGKETSFPFLHGAIQYHTGRKEDEGKGLLGY